MSKRASATVAILLSALLLASGSAEISAQNCPAAPLLSTPANTVAAGGTFNSGGVTIYNSVEAGPDSAVNRLAADTFDDSWRAGSTAAGLNTFSAPWAGGAAGVFTNGGTLFTFNGVTVTLSSVNMSLTLTTAIHPCAGGSLTPNPSLTGAGGTDMQDSSPRPQQLAGAGTYLDAANIGATTSRNAFRFNFSTPVKSFGAWFGDVETRTDSFGLPAIVRLLDASGNIIGQDVLVGTSTASAAQPASCDSSQGGTDPSGLFGCGSKTTRFIGFVDGAPSLRVSAMLVIVGDADREYPPQATRMATMETRAGARNIFRRLERPWRP